MSHDETITSDDAITLGSGAGSLLRWAGLVGAASLALGVGMGMASAGGYRRFLFAYLVALCFALTIALGALAFVLLQHLTRAGWSVTLRRPAEALTSTLPVIGLLFVPVVISVAKTDGSLYRWALPLSVEIISLDPHPQASSALDADPAQFAHPVLDPLTLKKRAWLNPPFWVARVILYFTVWSGIAHWYRVQSARQDRSGDIAISARMRWWAPLSLIVTAVTLTGAAFDLVMSLDPHWYSTIFGVYFLAGSFVSSFAALIVVASLLRRAGYVCTSITTEHFQDLGKYLFAFVFFWGYIAFSQYMLLWYANIPEETRWFSRHGATTVTADVSRWSVLAIVILVGHLLIPFAGLLSRHVKRNGRALLFWAGWLLVFHYLDLYWVILPEAGGGLSFQIVDIAALLGVVGILTAVTLRTMTLENLIPAADPRLSESLAFQNI